MKDEKEITDEIAQLEEEIQEFRNNHHSNRSYPIRKRRIRIEQLKWVLDKESDIEAPENPHKHPERYSLGKTNN